MTIAAILKDKARQADGGGTLVAAKPDDTILSVSHLLTTHGIGAVLVLNPDGSIMGILSERDIVRGLAKFGADLLGRKAETIMTRNVVVCSPHDSVQDAMHLMTRRRIRHLPVTEAGRVVGMISIGDVVKKRIADTEMEAEALRHYIATG